MSLPIPGSSGASREQLRNDLGRCGDDPGHQAALRNAICLLCDSVQDSIASVLDGIALRDDAQQRPALLQTLECSHDVPLAIGRLQVFVRETDQPSTANVASCPAGFQKVGLIQTQLVITCHLQWTTSCVQCSL